MTNNIILEIKKVIESKFDKKSIDINEELLSNKGGFSPVDLAILLKELDR